jgi:NAD(P)-dependent dehydrogenase (short-subunit alcohol dehydrogenase family)
MNTDLTGTVALITGATSGIGKATAFALAGRGAHVLVGGRNAARGDAVVTSLRASGAKADFIAVDLGSADSARELARRATERPALMAGPQCRASARERALPARGRLACPSGHARPRCRDKHHGPFGNSDNSEGTWCHVLSLVAPAVPSAVLRVERAAGRECVRRDRGRSHA